MVRLKGCGKRQKGKCISQAARARQIIIIKQIKQKRETVTVDVQRPENRRKEQRRTVKDGGGGVR